MHFPWIQFDGTLKMYRSLISRCALNIGRRAACRLQFQSGFDYSGCTKECSISWNLLDFWTVLKWRLLFEFCPPPPPCHCSTHAAYQYWCIYIWGYSFSPFPLSGHKSMKYDPKKKKQYCRQGGLPNETNGSAMTEQICKKINHIFWFRGLRLAGEELRNITSGVSRLSGEVGRLKAAAEPIIRLDRERPLAPTLDQLKGALANLVRGLKSKKIH